MACASSVRHPLSGGFLYWIMGTIPTLVYLPFQRTFPYFISSHLTYTPPCGSHFVIPIFELRKVRPRGGKRSAHHHNQKMVEEDSSAHFGPPNPVLILRHHAGCGTLRDTGKSTKPRTFEMKHSCSCKHITLVTAFYFIF